jgi:hypothetical protein
MLVPHLEHASLPIKKRFLQLAKNKFIKLLNFFPFTLGNFLSPKINKLVFVPQCEMWSILEVEISFVRHSFDK